MLQATIVAQFVNPPKPGKKRGTVKDQEDQYWGIFDPQLMNLFQPGCTYAISYEEQVVNGETYRTIKTAKPAQATVASPSRAHAGNGASPYYKPRDPSERRQIFVQGILQAAINAGKVELKANVLEESIRVLCGVYDRSPLGEGSEPAPRQH